jgi:hypothetical protein
MKPKRPTDKKDTQENYSHLRGRERQCVRLRVAVR